MFKRKDFVCLFVASIWALSLTGYRFGSGDHLSQFPSVLHFFDPTLYVRDFPYQMIFPPYLKVGLHIFLFSLARFLFLPVEVLYFLVFFLILLGFFGANFLILKWSGLKTPEIELSLYFLPLFAIFYPSISHFSVLGDILVPYQFVLPFLLLAIYLFLRQRFIGASLLVSFSFLVHQQLGLIVFISLFLTLFLSSFLKNEKDIKAWLSFFGPFFIVFCFYFLILQFLGSHKSYPWFDPYWGQELLEMVRFRVSHHLLLSYTNLKEKLSFMILVILVLWGLFSHRENPSFILGLIGINFLVLMFLGWLFSEVYPLPVVLNLYLFRSDVLLRLVAFYLALILMKFKKIFILNLLSLKGLRFFLIFLSIPFFFLGPHLRFSFPARNPIFQIGRCIQAQTPKESLILASPAIKGLRLYSKRSVVASFKSHGLFFSPDIAREWFRRMKILCDLPPDFSCLGKECLELCKKNFSHFSSHKILELGALFEVDYILVSNEMTLDLPKICEVKGLILYSF